jgi:hypothetical protein
VNAKDDFERMRQTAAWFVDRSSGEAPSLCVRMTKSRSYRVGVSGGATNESAILLKGGVLVCHADGTLWAMQHDEFSRRYSRCFSDGTVICPLSGSKMDQLRSLSSSNSQLRDRIGEMIDVPLLRSIRNYLKIRAERQRINEWNDQVLAHIRDAGSMPS